MIFLAYFFFYLSKIYLLIPGQICKYSRYQSYVLFSFYPLSTLAQSFRSLFCCQVALNFSQEFVADNEFPHGCRT